VLPAKLDERPLAADRLIPPTPAATDAAGVELGGVGVGEADGGSGVPMGDGARRAGPVGAGERDTRGDGCGGVAVAAATEGSSGTRVRTLAGDAGPIKPARAGAERAIDPSADGTDAGPGECVARGRGLPVPLA
jgi:hypothetical protein